MWQSVATVSSLDHTVTGLITGNQYAFRITAENAVGTGEPAELDGVVVPKSQFGNFSMESVVSCPCFMLTRGTDFWYTEI